MKIGVITWFKYNNYGTKLQALAMQEYLNRNGYKAELLNFSLKDLPNKEKNTFYSFSGRVLKKIANILFKSAIREKEAELEKVITKHCSVSNYISNDKEYINQCNKYDYLLFGSDQIWNPTWFHPYYYASFDNIKPYKIAYAPSIGVKKLPSKMINDYKKALSSFKNISMREKQSCDEIKKITNKSVCEVLDPTFLLNRSEWDSFENNKVSINKPYILCYLLTDNKNHWKAAKEYCKRKNKRMIIIPIGGHSFFISKFTIKNCDIGSFLHLINNCDEIITDSFHGTVFSLIYNKDCHVFERHDSNLKSSQNERVINLLNKVDLSDRLVKYNSSIIPDSKPIDYRRVNHIIEKDITKSKSYLKSCLK